VVAAVPGLALTDATPFVFGKLPSHGDFVQRGLSPAARDAWDEWASAGLSHAKASLDQRFDSLHESAPPWRFSIGPGPMGPLWRVGAVAPSADRVGRRFVVVAGADGLEQDAARGLARGLSARLEGLIYEALAETWDIDRLTGAVGGALAEGAADEAATPLQGLWSEDLGGPEAVLLDAFAPDCVLRMLTASQGVETSP
jgi:type VI secretion system protein ImpM